MPRFTEERIRRLCGEAITATSRDDAERVLTDLRAALEEHIRLAKDSLKSRMIPLPMAGSRRKKSP
jgi:hypothetical protein